MKLKKTSLATLLAAVVLVAGVTTAFATSAKPDDDSAIEAVTEDVLTTVALVSAEDGTVYLSYDGGQTYSETMTAEEYAARFHVPEIVWWTYDEYKEWLENEKIALQGMIGESGWTSGRGEFVWTQEIVDETVAMYEEILEDIKNGMLYSKTIDGDTDGMMISMNPADVWINAHEGPASEPVFTEYEPYGLRWDESEKVLYWNGERVRYFFDGADLGDLDNTGAMAIRLEYADARLKGEIDVYAVRERAYNSDGSFDPFGPLTGLEKYSQAEFDARVFRTVDSVKVQLVEAVYNRSEMAPSIEEQLAPYFPFGLSYRIHPVTGELSMSWEGKPVHSIYDAETGVWIANSVRGLYLGPEAVDLEAVYENGKLTGLQETEFEYTVGATYVAEGNATIEEPGIGFAERFEQYAPFGITYEEAENASGAGNVYYNGQLVSRFVDVTPEGGAFSFTSAKQGGITVQIVYGSNGILRSVKIVEE